jgi:superfamily II DNA/RNA helicase
LSDQTFHAAGVSERLIAALRARGISAPFRIQTLVLRDALAGRDVIAGSPTGSGKTLAFAIPIAQRLDRAAPTPSALVLVPTRELAQQVTDELAPLAHACGLRVAEVYGGVGYDLQARRARSAHALIATPGRLEDMLRRGTISLEHVRILVLDEADRMLDLGFQPAVNRILSLLPEDRQTMFFSATLDSVVAEHARRSTRNPIRVEATPAPEDTGEVSHRFVAVEHEHKVDRLLDLLDDERELALVFVRTKRGAARLTRRLEQRGVRAVALHGDMTQAQRARSLERFASGRADTLVATDVAARGLDVDDVTHVINFDPPADAATYTHRVGRTGRAGRDGVGITLVMPEQVDDVVGIARRHELHTGLERTQTRRGEAERRGEHRGTPPRAAAFKGRRRRPRARRQVS